MRRIRSTRGGVLLDAVVALGLFVITAFALNRLGVTFPILLSGVHHFLHG
ncbi:MAG: hypothetical protein WB789_05745 [Thermoplasmata archaeon]